MYYRCTYIYSHVTYVYECVSMYRDSGISLVAQWLGFCTSTAGSTSLIPGWGTKILPCSSAKTKNFFFFFKEREIAENSIWAWLDLAHLFLTGLKKQSKLFYSESNLAENTVNYFHLLIWRFCRQDTCCTLMPISHALVLSSPVVKWKSCVCSISLPFHYFFLNLLCLRSPFPRLQGKLNYFLEEGWILPFGFRRPKVGPVVCVSFI